MEVNNQVYDTLGERWYLAQDDPVALLRAESKIKNPWIQKIILSVFPKVKCRILDIACGAGFLSNDLALAGHRVTAVDLSSESLNVAKRWDKTASVNYQKADAYHLPFPKSHFDIVCMLGFLEHVEFPDQAIEEAARVLEPGGLFFFHTVNRNFFSWLVIIKGMEWFVRNTPPPTSYARTFYQAQRINHPA